MKQDVRVNQLMNVCSGPGATVEQIRRFAPFLKTLKATQRTIEALADSGVVDWAMAARALLDCISRPGGAAGFDEASAEFARTCLGLQGGFVPLTQRLADLGEASTHNVPRHKDTLMKRRSIAMSNLVSTLVPLNEFPCQSPQSIQGVAKIAAKQVATLQRMLLTNATKEDLLLFQRCLLDELTGAVAMLEKYFPAVTEPQAKILLITDAVVDKLYTRTREQMPTQWYSRFLPPNRARILLANYVPHIYKELDSHIEYKDTHTARKYISTARYLREFMLEIEWRDLWHDVLLPRKGRSRQLNAVEKYVFSKTELFIAEEVARENNLQLDTYISARVDS